MKTKPLFLLSLAVLLAIPSLHAQKNKKQKNIDYPAFALMTMKVQEYRKKRLIDIKKFNKYAKDEGTIILDCRSKAAYDDVHIAGAVHLNFSDFTDDKLASVIPSKDTRILIYCNNNFISPLQALASKRAPLALNIPTFINLYGYGYENIYELDAYIDQEDDRLALIVNENALKIEAQQPEKK